MLDIFNNNGHIQDVIASKDIQCKVLLPHSFIIYPSLYYYLCVYILNLNQDTKLVKRYLPLNNFD